MCLRANVYRVDLAVYFDDWLVELESGVEYITSVVYPASVAATSLISAVKKTRAMLGHELCGLKILKITVLQVEKGAEIIL